MSAIAPTGEVVFDRARRDLYSRCGRVARGGREMMRCWDAEARGYTLVGAHIAHLTDRSRRRLAAALGYYRDGRRQLADLALDDAERLLVSAEGWLWPDGG